MTRAPRSSPLVAACVHLALALCTRAATADDPPKPDETPAPSPQGAGAEPQGATAAADPGEKAEAKAEAKTIDVRVIGSSADALQKIPGSGQLIGAKDVARAQPYDVAELLRRVPGLVVRQEQGGGMRLDISVRGLDNTRSRRVLVLEDGVPVANNPYGEPDLYYATPFERVRGIEVVKGSGSILFGPQTVGGVVHFLTHAPPDSRRVYLWMNGGFPGQFELLGRYGDAWNDVRYVAQIFGKRGDGARGESYWATDAFAKLAAPISARSEVTAKIGFHEEAATSTDVGLTRDMFARDPRRPTIAPYDDVRVRRVDGSVTHKLWLGEGAELVTLAYATSTNRLWRRQDYTREPCDPADDPAVPCPVYERIVGDATQQNGAIYFLDTNTIRDRSYAVFGVEPRLTYRFTTGALGHTLDVGARFLTESASRAQRAGESVLSEAGSLSAAEDSGTVAIAGYVQDRIAFTDHLLVTPGFRFEYASSKRNIRRAADVGQPPRDVSIQGTSSVVEPIPGIGVVGGTPRLHGFAGLHVGFAPPRLATAITDGGIDAQLDAERAIHYEAGLRAAPWRFLRAEATFFLSNFQNQIVPTPRADGGTDLENGGRTRHVGVEAGVRFEVGRALSLPVSIDLNASYTGLSATFVYGPSDGKTLPYAPQHTASVVLDVEHRIGLGGQVAWNFVGPQFSDDQNCTEARALLMDELCKIDFSGRIGEIPAYHLLDVSLRYTHKPTGLGATLAIKNALDEIYIASRRPDGIFPSGFRQIIGGVRWTYDESAP